MSEAVKGEFAGRIALVTGGARGIGGGIAEGLAMAGATVVVCDILDDLGAQRADAIRADGGLAEYMHLDVCEDGNWQVVCREVAARHGRLDILVNAAGILTYGNVDETSLEEFKKVMDVSCDGMFLSLKHAAPLLNRRTPDVEFASVINISSIGAFRGAPNAMSYGASRAAIRSMTRSAALDFAGRGCKIRVNAVHPGSVQTDLSSVTYERLMKAGMTREEAVEHMTRLHPIGRLGTVEDVAGAVLYLASDRASWVTGTSLTVDGGRTA